MQRAIGEQRHHFPEQTAGEVRLALHQLVGIDPEKCNVVPERLQTDFGILIEIAFAQFQKSPERPEYAQVSGDRLARQGVEYHVYAFAAGGEQNFVCKIKTS